MARAFDREMGLRICAEYKRGASLRDLSLKHEVSWTTIRRILEGHGIERRTYSEAGKKYEVNHSHFANVDAPSKTYFLGFLMAEAYLRRKVGKGAHYSPSSSPCAIEGT